MTILRAAVLLTRLFGDDGPPPVIDKGELRHYIQSYVNSGRNPASLQRFLNRRNVSTAGLGFKDIAARAVAEFSNRRAIEGRSGLLIPRPGRDMIPSRFKIPANYRYVSEITYYDPDTGDTFTTSRSVYSQELITKTQVEALSIKAANAGLQSPRGPSDPYAPLQVQSASLYGAYYNEGTA